jgi:serine/threonine protein kinase
LGPDLHEENDPALKDIYLGRIIDGYEFLDRIGEGGMGVVYRVRRPGQPGHLAIKVIKRGMDTDTVLRRFHNERRILETLRHQNIAAMLDAGTTPEGLPYFVMEYIPGKPINEYCDAFRLSIDDRLRLFQKVCAAVQCAHEAHVVHRDIKPENILVTADGEPNCSISESPRSSISRARRRTSRSR